MRIPASASHEGSVAPRGTRDEYAVKVKIRSCSFIYIAGSRPARSARPPCSAGQETIYRTIIFIFHTESSSPCTETQHTIIFSY
jgi:hypothetical protein